MLLDIPWAVPPQFPGGKTSTRPSAHQFVSSHGPSYVSPPGPFLPPYQAGELSQFEKVYEHGDSDSETEEKGLQPPPPGVQPLNEASTIELKQFGPRRIWVNYPYDYMFLTGQYPPGTVTHSSHDYEQGNDYWQDAHYIRDYFPAYPSTGQVETRPAEAPQHVKQPSQPVKQSIGSTSYGQSGAATGHDQPSGAVGPQGSYTQAGAFEQPRQYSPAGGYGLHKVLLSAAMSICKACVN